MKRLICLISLALAGCGPGYTVDETRLTNQVQQIAYESRELGYAEGYQNGVCGLWLKLKAKGYDIQSAPVDATCAKPENQRGPRE